MSFKEVRKKKLLFVINSLNCGGAENALVSLLQVLDYNEYEVDLCLMKTEGIFLSKLPKEVKLLDSPSEFKYFDMPFFKALKESATQMRWDIFFSRLFSTYVFKTEKVPTIKDQKLWKYFSFTMKKQPKKYDVAIGYLENFPNNYVIDKVVAVKKIGFIRNDYKKLRMSPVLDKPYFEKFDRVLTVSESCSKILEETFPEMKSKFGYMLSVFSPKTISLMADENVTEDFSGFTVVTVGRLNAQKGYELAIEACSMVKQKGIDIKWYVLGIGAEKENMQKLIDKHNLKDNFILLGLKENPYPYIKKATIYAQTSWFEGKSRAIEEAKILHKPILVTCFPTVFDQIEHNVNGFIVDLNPEAIAAGIIQLEGNSQLKTNLINNLKNTNFIDDTELIKFYTIINS